ncbi:MAG TPA: membrane-bound PQQ-dependent dehydrogenase, glucose/quinate/shikimate family [Devosiaceae bacterium]|jgi:quinoprotein glucose dehydrogenase|nr:membrane-bound PQQ-dependent dehydrogenase, glucose/quinate/shikimate family [Devosiaceae bacterium]
MSHSRDATAQRRGIGFWLIAALALVLAVFGLLLVGGGVWLISLGGSWYYALAGAGLLLTAWFLFRQSPAAIWIYLLTYAATVVWALWEVGLDGWAQVPRLVAPTVVLVLVLLTIPGLRRGSRHGRGAVAASLAGLLAIGATVMMLNGGPENRLVAQETTVEVVPEAAPVAPLRPVDPAAGLSPARPMQPLQPPAEQPEAAPEASERSYSEMLEVGADWPAYGGTYHATRFSPLDQITRGNAGELEQVWEYRTGDLPEEDDGSEGKYAPETTPLVIDGRMYLCTAMNILIGLDADTGLEFWRYDPGVSTDAIPYSASCRGVAYYEAPDARPADACGTRVIEGTIDARLIAVDAQTGLPCDDFGTAGQVNLLEGIGDSVPGFFAVTSPPTIVRGVVVIGHQVLDNQRRDAPSGVVRGYDAITGELLWAWDMLQPDLDGLPPEGETYSRGTPNMWTIATGDDELGHVYLPMGNSAVDYYGATRTETENEYATSLVALDVTSGEVAWHFQTVHYDVWDYDLGSQGTLVDFPTAEGSVPALILPSKQGEIYVLDRATGEPLVPYEERPVPIGGVEPENLSPTQPFSLYHSLLQPDLEEKDMWGMTPLDQLWCRIQFREAYYEGVYTPPSADRRWIQYPGYNGGSDWGGISIDTDRGIIIANYNDMPNHNRLIPREEVDELGVRPIDDAVGSSEDAPDSLAPQAGTPYGIDVNAGWRVPFTGMLCKQPPYGGIRAIDLATGETLWDQPFGTARKNGPFGIPSMLPIDIGTPNNAGPILTASGLVIIAATTDDLIRAMDIETGEVVWQEVLPAGGQATPITYEVDGRQYVAIMAGGHHFMETPIGDYVIAWALPENE